MDEKPNPIKVAMEARKSAAKELAANRAELAKNVGVTFTDGEAEATVISFEPDKMIGPKAADSFLVTFDNPNAMKSIHCEEFLTQYKRKE